MRRKKPDGGVLTAVGTLRPNARDEGRGALLVALQVGEDLAARVLARLAGDPPPGWGPGATQVEPVEREAVPGVAEERPPQEELSRPGSP